MGRDNPSFCFSPEKRLYNIFFFQLGLWEKRPPLGNHVRLGTKDSTSQILSHMREWGGGNREQKEKKVEDDFINQSMITAELFPDFLTSGPRTGGVFKTHIYISHLS